MELFHKNYQKLKHLLERSRQVFEKLNLNEENLGLKSKESFRILVMGKNRRDRIDLINALVERELLNTTDISTSKANITIKWEERERAVIHFTNDISEEDFFQIDSSLKDAQNTLQIEIPVSKLHKYIPLNRILGNIDIFIPDSFCMDGIEILDIPEIQGTIREDEINEIGAKLNPNLILIILSTEELNEIMNREASDKSTSKDLFNSIFYIVNGSENINIYEKSILVQVLKNCTRFMEEGIFFTRELYVGNEINGIEGEKAFIPLIDNIRNAIHQEHRKESLYKPLYELTRIIKETILRIIAELYMTAEENAQDVEMIYNRTTAAVKRAQLHSENMNDRVIFFTERIKNLINEEVSDFIEKLPKAIESHMEGQEIKPSKDLMVDISKKIEEQVEFEMYEWIKGRIIPLIDASIKSITNEEEYSLRSFCYEIDSINRDYGRAKGIKQPAQKYITAFEKFSVLLKTGDGEGLNQYINSINESLLSKLIFCRKIFDIFSSFQRKSNSDFKGSISEGKSMALGYSIKYIKENSISAVEQITEEIVNQIEAFFEYIKIKINFEMERAQSRVEYLQEYKTNLQRATDKITECERELKEIDNDLIELVFETTGT